MRKLTLILFAALMLALFSCNVAQAPLGEESITMENVETGSTENYVEDDKNFVNGINQAYLKEQGITEDELISEILAEAVLEESSAEAGTRGVNFGFTGFFNINDMRKNPGKYFSCILNTSGAYVDVGLNKAKVNETLKFMPEIILENSKRSRMKAYDFSLSDIDGRTIIVNGRIHVKKYKRFLGKYRKILDVKGKVKVALSYRFDRAAQEIVLEKYRIKKVVGGPVVTLAGKILVRTKFAKGNLTERIPINFLPKWLMQFNMFYTTDIFLYTRLKFNKSDVNQVVAFARRFGINLRSGEAIPYFKNGDKVSIDGGKGYKNRQHLAWYKSNRRSGLTIGGKTMWTLKRYSPTVYSIGSIGIAKGTRGMRAVYGAKVPAKWTFHRLSNGKFTIKSGQYYLAVGKSSYRGRHSYYPVLSKSPYQWTIRK